MLLSACSGGGTPDPQPDPSQVVRSLGAVPIPSAAAAEPTESAHPGHPAVLAIGGPVQVTLPGGATALATATGPRQLVTDPNAGPGGSYPDSTRAIITLKLTLHTGSATLAAAQLSSRDETGRSIALTPVGVSTRAVAAGSTATVQVAGTFDSGAAQVTWTQGRSVMAIWTFNIELD